MTSPPLRVVVTDANVLINLMHVARLELLAELPDLEIVVPDHVREEIRVPEQRAMLDSAVDRGLFRIELITEPNDVDMFVELTTHLGHGEAACLVLAVRHGWTVASDEKRRFRREAVSRIGGDRIIGTADLFIHAINAGLITLEEADEDKAMLEDRRFKMPFSSFREMAPVALLFQQGELTEVQVPTTGAELATRRRGGRVTEPGRRASLLRTRPEPHDGGTTQ